MLFIISMLYLCKNRSRTLCEIHHTENTFTVMLEAKVWSRGLLTLVLKIWVVKIFHYKLVSKYDLGSCPICMHTLGSISGFHLMRKYFIVSLLPFYFSESNTGPVGGSDCLDIFLGCCRVTNLLMFKHNFILQVKPSFIL